MTRDASSIGAGLARARDARAIIEGTRIHIVGVGGAGASAAAILAHHAGALVTGCDPGGPSPYTAALDALGIASTWAHDAAHVTKEPRPDRLAVTKALTAIDPEHPELVAARAAGLVPEPWQQVVADAAVGRTLVAVAGTHGKSTTAGWLVHVLVEAGRDPSAFVGALLPGPVTGGVPATARQGAGTAFVVEADEYAGNFDPYRPAVAVLTGAEWDHPDVFADRRAVEEAFAGWLQRVPDGASLVINLGDEGARTVLGDVLESARDRAVRVIGYALVGPGAADEGFVVGTAGRSTTSAGPATMLLGRIVGAEPDGTTLEIDGLDPGSGPVSVRLRTAGRHNAANALAVAGAALALGLDANAIAPALAGFEGVGRRLERKGEVGGVVVYDDYGHHPTAIRLTIDAVRQREPGRSVWAVYEPLTYHRTAALLDEFAAALAAADAVAIAEIWAGRDPDTTVASAGALAAAVRRRRPDLVAEAPGSVDATADWLAGRARPGDAVLVMGGGHSYRIGERLLTLLRAAAESDETGGRKRHTPESG